MTTTARTITQNYRWVDVYRDAAPEAMKPVVAAAAVNLATSAQVLADDLDRMAARMARTAALVRQGQTLAFASDVAEARDFARLTVESAVYETDANAWSGIAAVLDMATPAA